MIKKNIFSYSHIWLSSSETKNCWFISLPIITKDLTEVDYGVFGVFMALYSFCFCHFFIGASN